MYSQKQELVACMSLNGMLSSKRWRKLALHPVYMGLSDEDNDSVSGGREKDDNSLRLMSFSANSRAASLLNMSLSASAFLIEIFDVFVENIFNLFFFIG